MEQPTIDMLREQGRTGTPEQQIAAVNALLHRRVYSAGPTIIELLTSPDTAVRFSAAHALAVLGKRDPAGAGAALMPLLADPEDLVRSEAVDTLGLLHYQPALDLVRALLRSDPEALVRASAAETLGDLEDSRALPDLEYALQDSDAAVRGFAANAIGLLDMPASIATLQSRLAAEPEPSVQAELAGALYRLGVASSLERLLDLMAGAGEAEAPGLLNLLMDLAERHTPTTLAADALRLAAAIRALAVRWPITRGDADAVLAAFPPAKP